MEITKNGTQELRVVGESIERIFGDYQANKYIVNRRYQRKLVWTLHEKQKFIDSIISGFPIPIVLLAERKTAGNNCFEIIDGMQRLNAVFSYILNDYDINGCYFDLNTMAETKLLLDSGTVVQKSPLLSRDACIKIARYPIPLSIYEFTGSGEVDEVFRRINSGGRKLSRQELRIAGAVGHFSQAVRLIASKIRGDVSLSDILPLNEMGKISITNRDLDYGINVEDVFWVKNGVLTKEQVRESRDEEIIADLLAYMVLDEKPASRSEYLDDYFNPLDGEASRGRYSQIEIAVQKITQDVVISDFMRVLDQIKLIIEKSQKTFGSLILGDQPPKAPRYFQIIFLALHKLIVSQNLEVGDWSQLITTLSGCGDDITIPEGGRWGAGHRINSVNATAGRLTPVFQAASGYDPGKVRWITQFETILGQSYTEQATYEFKQGLLNLDDTKSFNKKSFEKILKTLVGIANIEKNTRGYVIVGVADKVEDAMRIEKLHNICPTIFERFRITGVEHEAITLCGSLDDYYQFVMEKIKESKISQPLKDSILRNVKLIKYYDKSILIFEAQAQETPSNYDGQFYIRHGNRLEVVASDQYAMLFQRFLS